jgi:formylmethanofuran dehydrogenase subunit E
MKWQWIVDLTSEELKREMRAALDFHQKPAPGTVIGVHMVDAARKALGETQGVINAVVETIPCLPDPVAVMTGCTVGNKYLWLMESGRYALCLYDRDSKKGIRVSIDHNKLNSEKTPHLEAFFTNRNPHLITKRNERQEEIIREFFRLDFSIFRIEEVTVNLPTKPPLKDTAYCENCTEYFKTLEKEDTCPECSELHIYKKSV